MLGGVGGLFSSPLWAAQGRNERQPKSDEAEIARVEKQARDSGLGPFSSTKTEHFLVIGDAPLPFQREAVQLCENLGKAFLAHFRARHFAVDYPVNRLTLIVLKDEKSYAGLLKDVPGKVFLGHYDLETNRLAIFDFRSRKEGTGAQAEQDNLLALAHETAHQLMFNTSMLDRRGNLPLCILEGLANYVETWRPGAKNSIGAENRRRLEALRQAEDWISIPDLLADDKAFAPQTEQLAYAESWLLVHYMLRSTTRQPRFRNYLARAQAVTKPDERISIAEATLGSLNKLDRDVKNDGREYLRG
jgi:hypothetical protein